MPLERATDEHVDDATSVACRRVAESTPRISVHSGRTVQHWETTVAAR
jgi:hypothetical protein